MASTVARKNIKPGTEVKNLGTTSSFCARVQLHLFSPASSQISECSWPSSKTVLFATLLPWRGRATPKGQPGRCHLRQNFLQRLCSPCNEDRGDRAHNIQHKLRRRFFTHLHPTQPALQQLHLLHFDQQCPSIAAHSPSYPDNGS